MAKKPTPDGFVPRRAPGVIGDIHRNQRQSSRQVIAREIYRPEHNNDRKHQTAAEEHALAPAQERSGLTRADIDESLNQIDQVEEPKKTPRVRRTKSKSSRPKRSTIIKRIVIVLAILLLLGVAWVAIRAFVAGNAIFNGDILGIIQHQKLKEDEGGRTNILIVGTSEDDPGHEGAHLTDSIMVLSVNQTTKDAFMISIPRDLEVRYDEKCTIAGYAGKINAYFNCVNPDWTTDEAEAERQAASREFFGKVLGIDIQYSTHVNYSVMRDVVKALGTITVDIQGSNGAPGIMDSNFDWKCKGGNEFASRATMIKNCPPNGHFIDYPNGPAELDAEHALYLAQARGDMEPTYGLSNSNFDREQNQQKIIVAIRDKALSAGTLTNFAAVTGLIDAMGSNLRTNFEMSEVRTLLDLALTIPPDSINSVDMLGDKVMDGNGQPVAGMYNYSGIQAYLKKKLYATEITKEDAKVLVLNASGVAGAAQVEADKLNELGMTATAANAPEGSFAGNMVYQLGDVAKPKTAEKLTSMYRATPSVVADVPGVVPEEGTNYVVILVSPPPAATESE